MWMGINLARHVRSSLSELRKVRMELLDVITEYARLREELEEILDAYDASSPEEILEKMKTGKLPEHPTYEDYLEAKSLLQDAAQLKNKLKELIERF